MKTLFAFTLILFNTALQAQEIKNFTLMDTKNGKDVSLTNYNSSKAVVIIFTSHECPFDNYYKDRIKNLIQTYTGKVQFLLVNSNTEDQESVAQMAIHYTDLPVPYLADKDQVVMSMLGPKKTPEVFLLSSAGATFSVKYSGAMDDNPQAAKDVHQNFLKDALEKVLAGQNVTVATQRATGCTIRKK
jgi:peroxiredoxin